MSNSTRSCHANLPMGTVLYNQASARIRVTSMTGEVAHCEHVTLDGVRDRRFAVGFTSHLPLDSWKIVARKDHSYEHGDYNVCPRCGDDRAAHDRLAGGAS